MYNFLKNTTVACPATPSVNISQPQSYMTRHKHTPQSFQLKHNTKRMDAAGMRQQFAGCKNKLCHLSCSQYIMHAEITDYIISAVRNNLCKLLSPKSYHKIYFKSLNSLLCAVDELVLIGPLKACLHSFIVPQLLCVIKELLGKKN